MPLRKSDAKRQFKVAVPEIAALLKEGYSYTQIYEGLFGAKKITMARSTFYSHLKTSGLLDLVDSPDSLLKSVGSSPVA